jgi:hypothetical protein
MFTAEHLNRGALFRVGRNRLTERRKEAEVKKVKT